jgi:prophage antirepressor-like protein
MKILFQSKRCQGQDVVEIDGEIWFVASDVANLLGYKRANDAVRQHCKDKGTVKRRIPTKQGEQEMLLKNIVHLKLLEWSNKGDR